MTGSRVNTSAIGSTQNHKKCPRPRIGMRRQTVGTISYATERVCAITKIPVVSVEAWSSSVENSRTARSHNRIRHKINPRHRLNKHKTAGHCYDNSRIRNSHKKEESHVRKKSQHKE